MQPIRARRFGNRHADAFVQARRPQAGAQQVNDIRRIEIAVGPCLQCPHRFPAARIGVRDVEGAQRHAGAGHEKEGQFDIGLISRGQHVDALAAGERIALPAQQPYQSIVEPLDALCAGNRACGQLAQFGLEAAGHLRRHRITAAEVA